MRCRASRGDCVVVLSVGDSVVGEAVGDCVVGESVGYCVAGDSVGDSVLGFVSSPLVTCASLAAFACYLGTFVEL